MATYSEIKAGLNSIAIENERHRADMNRAKQVLVATESALNAMTTTYSSLIADINAAATANPTVEAFQVAKSEKNELVSDFQDLNTRATALVAAVNGI